jgi:hypothetical protein
MTAFIITSIAIFFVSIVSNIIFILNNYTESKFGAVIGLILFTSMMIWGFTLLF